VIDLIDLIFPPELWLRLVQGYPYLTPDGETNAAVVNMAVTVEGVNVNNPLQAKRSSG
jgi:hypothetical protein